MIPSVILFKVTSLSFNNRDISSGSKPNIVFFILTATNSARNNPNKATSIINGRRFFENCMYSSNIFTFNVPTQTTPTCLPSLNIGEKALTVAPIVPIPSSA
ncbi:hypothetical protein D3C73_1326410 [compost metagenome]